jgi:hypothetical protein
LARLAARTALCGCAGSRGMDVISPGHARVGAWERTRRVQWHISLFYGWITGLCHVMRRALSPIKPRKRCGRARARPVTRELAFPRSGGPAASPTPASLPNLYAPAALLTYTSSIVAHFARACAHVMASVRMPLPHLAARRSGAASLRCARRARPAASRDVALLLLCGALRSDRHVYVYATVALPQADTQHLQRLLHKARTAAMHPMVTHLTIFSLLIRGFHAVCACQVRSRAPGLQGGSGSRLGGHHVSLSPVVGRCELPLAVQASSLEVCDMRHVS